MLFPVSQKNNKRSQLIALCMLFVVRSVLKYYRRLNPQCIITIENPRGYLSKTRQAQTFREGLKTRMVHVSYCHLAGTCGLGGDEDSSRSNEQLPQKHTILFTSSHRLYHLCKNDAMRCRNNCGGRDVTGRRHQKGVYAYEDRMSAYPRAFCEMLALNLTADMRAQMNRRRQSDSSTFSSSESS